MKISVIIPVYNVEKYLRQCLDSVVNQTYKDLEIICVNDCSTDSSYEILKEYERKDERITIISNKKNSKQSFCRNKGLKIAKGEYIHHLDSDDWMNPDAYEKLVKYLTQDIDILHFTYREFNIKTNKIENFNFKRKEFVNKTLNIYDNPDILDNWSRSNWAKLYKKSFIEQENIYFDNEESADDIEYSIKSLLKAKNIRFAEENVLNYRHLRKDSSTENFIERHARSSISSYFKIDKMCKNIDKKIAYKILEAELYTFFYSLEGAVLYKKDFSYEEAKKVADNLDLSFLKNPSSYYWYGFYKGLTTLPKHIFELRCFLKKNFPTLFNLAINIKKVIK